MTVIIGTASDDPASWEQEVDSPIQRYSGAWPALKWSKKAGFFFFISSAHFLLFSKMRSWLCWRYLRTSWVPSVPVMVGQEYCRLVWSGCAVDGWRLGMEWPVWQDRAEARVSSEEKGWEGEAKVELDKGRAEEKSCPAATSSRRAWGNRCGMAGTQDGQQSKIANPCTTYAG